MKTLTLHGWEAGATKVNQPGTILFIEDQLIFSNIMTRAITHYTPHHVVHREDGSQIREVIREYKPDLLVLDYDLPGMNGLELYDLVHATPGMEHIPALIVSATLPRRALVTRKLAGLQKPCTMDDFVKAIEAALAQSVLC